MDAAVSDIDASIHKLMEEKPAEDLEDTRSWSLLPTHAGGASGGLYGDLTGYSAAQAEAETPGEKSGAPEEPAAQRRRPPPVISTLRTWSTTSARTTRSSEKDWALTKGLETDKMLWQ